MEIVIVFVVIVLAIVFLFIGAGIQGVNKAKAAAYLASKYDEQRKKDVSDK